MCQLVVVAADNNYLTAAAFSRNYHLAVAAVTTAVEAINYLVATTIPFSSISACSSSYQFAATACHLQQ